MHYILYFYPCVFNCVKCCKCSYYAFVNWTFSLFCLQVAVTIYWLGRVATASNFEGPQLDFNAFSGLFEHHHVNLIPEKTSVYSSYWENKRLQSNHTTKPGIIHEERTPKDHDDQHAGDSSYESIGSKGSDDTHSVGSGDGMLVNSDMYSLQSSTSSLNKANKVYSGNLENDMYHSTPNIYQGKLPSQVFIRKMNIYFL